MGIDNTDSGEQALSVEQAANAFAKATTPEPQGQTDGLEDEQGAQADEELQSSEEGEGEESGEPEEEGQAEEEDGAEPETDQGRFVAANGKVRLSDGTVLTVSDLIAGNLRDRDYRQKTMGLADERRTFEEQSSAFKASKQQVEEQRAFMSSLLQSILPQPPDPALIAEGSPKYDPFAYLSQKEQYERVVGHLNALHQQSEQSRQEADRQTKAQRDKKAAEEWDRLQEAIPDLRDKAKADAIFSDIAKAGQEYGFTQQELAETLPYDHRFVPALRDAARWRKLQASKPNAVQQVQNRPPVQKSGKRLTPDAQKARRAVDAMSRLKETGSIDDAASAYLATRKG